jgi:hypothetical protein
MMSKTAAATAAAGCGDAERLKRPALERIVIQPSRNGRLPAGLLQTRVQL